MRKTMWTAFVVFWTAVATLLIVAALAPEPSISPAAVPAPDAPEMPAITLDEVARHATEDDCWMVIRGMVYDFTDYIPQHPTAPEIMTEWCGKEATEAYETKTYGSPHSAYADRLMEQYAIGPLESTEPVP